MVPPVFLSLHGTGWLAHAENTGSGTFLSFPFTALWKTPVPSQKICLKGAGRACTHQPGSSHRTLLMNASFGDAAVPEWNAKLPPRTLPVSSDPLWWLCSQSPHGQLEFRPGSFGHWSLLVHAWPPFFPPVQMPFTHLPFGGSSQ